MYDSIFRILFLPYYVIHGFVLKRLQLPCTFIVQLQFRSKFVINCACSTNMSVFILCTASFITALLSTGCMCLLFVASDVISLERSSVDSFEP